MLVATQAVRHLETGESLPAGISGMEHLKLDLEWVWVYENEGKIQTGIFENGVLAQVAGQNKTDEQLLKSLAENPEFKDLFQVPSDGGAGGNARQTGFNGNGKVMRRTDFDKLSPSERTKVMSEKIQLTD